MAAVGFRPRKRNLFPQCGNMLDVGIQPCLVTRIDVAVSIFRLYASYIIYGINYTRYILLAKQSRC